MVEEYLPAKMQEARDQFNSSLDLGGASDPRYWAEYLDASDIEAFHQHAYANADGLAIRTNPITGYKEMYISGSRNSRDWMQNVLEAIDHGFDSLDDFIKAYGAARKGEKLVEGASWGEKLEAADPQSQVLFEWAKNALSGSEASRDRYSSYLDMLVVEDNIDVVYGHSRGSAIMSGMKSNVKKVSLDGAMYIGHEVDYINIANAPFDEETGVFRSGFDYAISSGYKNNVYVKNRAWHDVSRGYNVKKHPKPKPSATSIRQKKKRRHRTRGEKSYDRRVWFDRVAGHKPNSYYTKKWIHAKKKKPSWWQVHKHIQSAGHEGV